MDKKNKRLSDFQIRHGIMRRTLDFVATEAERKRVLEAAKWREIVLVTKEAVGGGFVILYSK